MDNIERQWFNEPIIQGRLPIVSHPVELVAFAAEASDPSTGITSSCCSPNCYRTPVPSVIAIRSLQREIICGAPKWNNGQYDFDDPPIQGMPLARTLGLISYRSAEELTHRFGRKRTFNAVPVVPPSAAEFDVDTYPEHDTDNLIGPIDNQAVPIGGAKHLHQV